MAWIQALVSSRSESAEEWFSARAAETQKRVFQIAYSVLGNAADAEEVAQDVFFKAYRNLWRLRDAGKFRQWVCRMAFRAALNRLRQRRRQVARDTAWHVQQPEAVADGTRLATERISLGRLRARIEALPEKLRCVLLLCGVEEMDSSEAARVLGIPAGTVRSRLHAARKRLLAAEAEDQK